MCLVYVLCLVSEGKVNEGENDECMAGKIFVGAPTCANYLLLSNLSLDS